MKKFIIQLSALSLICAALNSFIQFLIPRWNLSFVYLTLIYFWATTLLVFYISMLGLGKSNQLFIKAFMTGLWLHLFLSIGWLAVWLGFIRDASQTFNVPYIVSYILINIIFTGFEIMKLIANLRPFSKKPETSEK